MRIPTLDTGGLSILRLSAIPEAFKFDSTALAANKIS